MIQTGRLALVDSRVDQEMVPENIKVEVKREGRWGEDHRLR
jgi:hypothetical protein